MAFFGCSDRWTCPALAVVVSVVVGVVTAFLRITAAITVAPLFIQTVLVTALLYLAVTLLAAALTNRDSCRVCLYPALKVQLGGILGSVLASLVLLAVGFPATSIVGAVIIGFLLFFFSLMLTATACVVKCLFSAD